MLNVFSLCGFPLFPTVIVYKSQLLFFKPENDIVRSLCPQWKKKETSSKVLPRDNEFIYHTWSEQNRIASLSQSQ